MQPQTEQSNGSNQTLTLRVEPRSSFNEEWRTTQFLGLGEAFREPLTAELLAIYVEGTADLNDEQIKQGIGLAIRELTFFPKVAELRALAGQGGKQLAEGEALKAWEIVTDFADKWVQSDVHGGYVIDQGCRSTRPPKLSEKILSCVRRCGDWRAFKTMSAADLPFQRGRFLEEYKHCEITGSIPLDRLLTAAKFTPALKARTSLSERSQTL